jgi:ribose-phosphate pyrophosphokinase
VSDHLFELCITLDALRSASARRITAVIPYYSYARSDKKDAPRISIAGRLVAEILATAGADRVLTMDLHSDQVQGFFSVPVDHLSATRILAEHFKRKVDPARTVVVASDAGGAKRAGRFAERLKLPLAIIDKRRIDDAKVQQGFLVGEVAGRDAIVFDDEIAAASTMVESYDTLRAADASSISAVATHGVLCGPAIERLRSRPFKRIVVTDTVAIPREKRMPNLTVLSVAPILAETIRRIHTGESVGALFS